jgi:prolipoprotein diacylglyceryltransferase
VLPAVVTFDFDPLVDIADGLTVRWQTIVLAGVILLALVALGWLGRRNGLRADDMLFAAVGVVPGAVIGGRLGYALIHADYYAANPSAIVDPGQGSLALGLAVVGGALTAAYILRLLEAPVAAWFQVAAVPLLFAIGAGKLAMALGGAGQGAPSDVSWATAYAGIGPWGSLGPDVAAHPSQIYEGVATLIVAIVLAGALAAGALSRPEGRGFVVALLAWTAIRFAAAVTWRDAAVVGPLGADQLVSIAIALGCVVVLLRSRSRAADADAAAVDPVPGWPDPETRPRF